MKRLMIALALLAAFTSTGCYQYHVAPCTPAPGNPEKCGTPTWDPATDYESHTVHALFWGIKPGFLPATVCPKGSAIDQVRVENNILYDVAKLVTLGIYAPMRLSYKCSKRVEGTGTTGDEAQEDPIGNA